MIHDLLLPIGLGIAYAAAPGVVNTESLRRGMAGGFRPAMLVQLGSILGDCIWAIIALTGVAALATHQSLMTALGLVGGLFLRRIAFDAIRASLSPLAAETSGTGGRAHFRTGAIFGLANPAGIAFWAGAGGSLIAAAKGDPATYASFVLAFLIGALCWCVGFAVLVARGRRYVRPGVIRGIDGVCGAVLGYFGIRLLWTTLHRWAVG